jgi:hypothetical protein
MLNTVLPVFVMAVVVPAQWSFKTAKTYQTYLLITPLIQFVHLPLMK